MLNPGCFCSPVVQALSLSLCSFYFCPWSHAHRPHKLLSLSAIQHVTLGGIIPLQPYKYVFCWAYSSVLQEDQKSQSVLTEGKIVLKQHKSSRGFCLWEQLAVLNLPQSFYSLGPSLTTLKLDLEENFPLLRFRSPGQGPDTPLSASHSVMNVSMAIPHCFSWNQSKSVSPCSSILRGGILPCGRCTGIQKVQAEFTGFNFKYNFI